MIRTVIRYTVDIEYESETKDVLYREVRASYLQNAIEHMRQENMLGRKYESVNWAIVDKSHVRTSIICKEENE